MSCDRHGQPDDLPVRLAIHGSEVPDCVYVPFFGAFGAAWDIVASWSANPLGCFGRIRMRRSSHRVTATVVYGRFCKDGRA
jgi:hypothetical protein